MKIVRQNVLMTTLNIRPQKCRYVAVLSPQNNYFGERMRKKIFEKRTRALPLSVLPDFNLSGSPTMVNLLKLSPK